MNKSEVYELVQSQIAAVLEGEPDLIACMATVSCLLSQAFPGRFFWTGFYVVDPLKNEELVVGPYQGTLGCLRIAFSRGVCGAAARTRETQIVEDVHAVKDHIACDAQTNSEIVVPVFGANNDLIAVLDIDSTEFSAFDEEDKVALEAIVKTVFASEV